MLKAPVAFELSVLNVDKPPLERAEIQRRVAQFADKDAVVVTRAPTFREKACLLPGCTFIIGWDTAVRLLDPTYYQESEIEMLRALLEIRDLGCRFLVAGRVNGECFKICTTCACHPRFETCSRTYPRPLSGATYPRQSCAPSAGRA